jgi:hypothetical protein
VTVSVDELKRRFGPALFVAPYGECLVIQGAEFDPDWEAELGDLGFACHFGDLDGHVVTFVQLKKAAAAGKVVYVPPPKPAVIPEIQSNDVEVKETEKVEKKVYALKGPSWTEEDEIELLKAYDGLVSEGKKYGCIQVIAELPRFKGRSSGAIIQKLKKLKKRRAKGEGAGVSQVEKVEKITDVEAVLRVDSKQGHGNPRPTMPWLKDVDFWSLEEDALIVELWKKGLTLVEIDVEVNKKYPKRVGYAVTGRVYQLQKKGSIEKRHKLKLKAATTLNVTKGDKSTGKVDVEVLPASAKYVPFSDIWAFASSRETDLKQRAEAFYKAATGVNLDGNIIGSVITCFEELDALRGLNDNQIDDLQKFSAEINDKLGALQKQLISHKHAVSGEAMLPMEASR